MKCKASRLKAKTTQQFARYDRPKLDDTLLEHGLSHLHEAGDVGALHVVNMTVGLCAELNASLVDALHDVVQLIVNFLG